MSTIREVRCSLCGSDRTRRLYQKNGYELRRCTACGMVFVSPMPTPAQLADIYAEQYFSSDTDKTNACTYGNYAAEAEALMPNFNARLTEIEALLPGKGKILDIGCAYGFFLKAANDRGWISCGVDYSAHAVSYARNELGLNVVQGDPLQTTLPDAPFDVVTMWDTIEHLVNPQEMLCYAAGLLRPGGLMAVGTDDVESLMARLMGRNWYMINPPWHLHHFSRSTLGAALDRAGLRVIEVKRKGKLFGIRTIGSRLSVFYPSRITRYINRKLQSSSWGRRTIYVNRGDWICGYARK